MSVALLVQGKQVEAQALKSDLDKSWTPADMSLRVAH
jgi:hypothetical protein